MDLKNLEPIKHIKVEKGMKVSEIVEAMADIGFQARKLGEAGEIFVEMVKDEDCKVFFGMAGALIPGGMKQIVLDMLNSGIIDVFVTTGANLTHDLIEALGHKHYKGDEHIDDSKLRENKIDRIYNVYMKDNVYFDLEDFFVKIYPSLKKEMNIKEFLWELGKNIEAENSILKTCYENKIPIFCPGIADSGIGVMIWGRLYQGVNLEVEEQLKQRPRIKVDVFDDLREILDIAWTSKKSGVLYVGGGLPKNFVQQALQFNNIQDGASYGIQITTDRPEPGGSSGAPLHEGISWGKMNKEGKNVTLFCDATIALPLIWGYAKDKI